MKRMSIPVVLAVLLACVTSAWAQDRDRVHVQNGSVYGDDGVKLRGSTNNPDSAYPGIGQSASIWKAARDTYHLNVLRCACYRGLYNGATPTTTWANIPIPKLLPLLDTFVNQASQYGFYILIDYHSEALPDPNDFASFWQAVAPRYANRTHVLYEIANEYSGIPYPASLTTFASQPSDYGSSDIQWQQNAYHLIRSLAPSTHIITNSFADPGGSMLSVAQQQASGPNAIDYSNASLGFHYPLGFPGTPGGGAPSSVLACKAQFPVICTEGADISSATGWTSDPAAIAWHEANGIAWFTLSSALDGSNPIYDPPPTWPVTWPVDPNTSDGTGPNNKPPPAPPPPPPSSGALIGDPNYAQQTGGNGNPLIAPWWTNGPATTGLDSYDGVNGGPCGYIFDGGTGAWTDIKQTGGVGANTHYTLSVMIQTSSPFPGGSLGVYTSDGTVLAQQSFAELDNYTQVSVSFNSGSATTLTIFAGLTGFSGQASWIHVDNWSLKTGGGGGSGGANLIQDPNYTQQTEGNGNPLTAPWSGTGPAVIGLDSADGNGHSPTPCGFIFDSGTGAWSAITQTVAVTPNTNYTLSCFIQTSSPFPGGSLGAWAPGGTLLGQCAFGEQDNYTLVSVSFNSGSATSVTVFAGFTGYSGMASWIHVDNWSMVDPPGVKSASTSTGGLTSAASSGGGKAACGLTGLETVFVLGLLAMRRRKA